MPKVLRGDMRDNTILGSPDSDTIGGLRGNDTLIGFGGDDTLDGGDGADLIDLGPGDDNVTGDDGDDTILPGDGSDVVYAEEGSNKIIVTSDGVRDDLWCRQSTLDLGVGYVIYVGDASDQRIDVLHDCGQTMHAQTMDEALAMPFLVP